MNNKERDEKVWEKFILLLLVETFGEPAVFTEGKIQKVLLGSAEHHKRVFMQAAEQTDIEAEIVK